MPCASALRQRAYLSEGPREGDVKIATVTVVEAFDSGDVGVHSRDCITDVPFKLDIDRIGLGWQVEVCPVSRSGLLCLDELISCQRKTLQIFLVGIGTRKRCWDSVIESSIRAFQPAETKRTELSSCKGRNESMSSWSSVTTRTVSMLDSCLCSMLSVESTD